MPKLRKKKVLPATPSKKTSGKIKLPVSEGEEYDLEIEEERLHYGVGFVKQFPVFVPDATEGDSVHVKIIKVGKDHAIARIMSSEEPFHPGENLKEQYAEAEKMASAGLIGQPAVEAEDE